MTRSEELISALRQVLADHPEVELALLLDSPARGHSGGAFDVLVEGEAVDRLGLACELSAAVGLDVLVRDLRTADYPLLRALLRDGVVIHEGRPRAEARFRTRAILQTETDRPWYERMRDAYLRRLASQADSRPWNASASRWPMHSPDR